MILTHILLCSLILEPAPAPQPLLVQLYVQEYGCHPLRGLPDKVPALDAPEQEPSDGDGTAAPLPGRVAKLEVAQAVVAMRDIGSYFPAEQRWWPLFTDRQAAQPIYRQMLGAGVKPGVLLPENPLEILKPSTYRFYYQAVQEGAIVVQPMRNHQFDHFAARASFASALGLRPLAALVVDGWSDNLLAAGKGAYLIDHRGSSGYGGLPVPARQHEVQGRYIYHASDTLPHGGGFAVVIDPQYWPDGGVGRVDYPELGLSWEYLNSDFHSRLEGLETSPMGHVLAMATLLSVPVGLFFATPWPNVLQWVGTSISWVSLVIGAGLLLLLILAALRRLRRLW
ncbi:hypothetical protein SAMN02745117_00230 [Lampropedia hyalina DSM 16112]|jgi:hypothetical protein|uniref:Uncharacterized protein n=1 Tax=Lampropedia hyalina DSM 16112 TaxID=1122156 RepID=A0A1M4T5A8_9BURK|nr:hypothetical protein [Lampropedia hyalina]SHE39565.1 hypothetical protein SAMN02745117_00230 [Lampropedia hyalina DSM 16112]